MLNLYLSLMSDPWQSFEAETLTYFSQMECARHEAYSSNRSESNCSWQVSSLTLLKEMRPCGARTAQGQPIRSHDVIRESGELALEIERSHVG